ncbi:hypothetical protein P154DRAFT_518143 [Amniculicola lignicola CBS 123094]|uniref:YggU-like protein n=1 Tax=Amniculicola lignicola CBS 123094 TaxID=1392246 RepID=A0A6A5WXQ1_9PLEO|nr:hypothetical protein P154DRAFT_518143 [Amniculicola lignicola CBS 123094]
MSAPAIRFIIAKGSKSQIGSIQLLCHVKPGVSANREGIAAVTDEQIELCVAARAQEGGANRAVREVISKVYTEDSAILGLLTRNRRSRSPSLMSKSPKG